MSDPYEDDDAMSQVLYDDGHWEWDETTQSLAFISNVQIKDDAFEHIPVFFGPIEFRDDLDVIEQLRFRKRYQRKLGGEEDVVLLQDIKDVVLYTAPSSIMLPTLIKIMHLSTTERFVRALILYSQYFVQVSEEMTRRIDEQEAKVRTSESFEIELTFRDNLEDLRILVAKEYCTMLIGGSDFHAYHHMGALKNTPSLSNKDACLFEAILRMCIQIVWIALGRKCFHLIECEIHRMFKSEIFNLIEHKIPSNVKKMSPQERFVLLGHCVQKQTKLKTQSPLLNEVFCHRRIDYRLFGLGTIKDSNLTYRQKYFELVLTASESSFHRLKLTLGIVGMPRAQFDTMLREIKFVSGASTSSANIRNRMSRLSVKKSTASVGRRTISMRKSTLSMGKSIGSIGKSITTIIQLYPPIVIPEKGTEKEWQPEEFPHKSFRPNVCSRLQRRKWLDRALRLRSKRIPVSKKI